MTRSEARVLAAFALLAVTGAVTWLWGAYGLGAVGLVVLVAVLFLVDIDTAAGVNRAKEPDGEVVAGTARPGGHRHPVVARRR